jgi:hypothetical protein
MGVSAQQQTEIGMGRLLINFRRVRKQDRERVARYPGTGLFDVVRTVEMRIIDASDIYALIISNPGRAQVQGMASRSPRSAVVSSRLVSRMALFFSQRNGCKQQLLHHYPLFVLRP